MAHERFGTETTVVPVLREDGTVYFSYVRRPIGDRLYESGLAVLWFLVAAVLVGMAVWI